MSGAAEPWRALVSARVGIVTGVAPQPRSADEPQPPYLYTATLSHFDFRNAPRGERIAAGKGSTEGAAMASAVGEAMERYCAWHWDHARTTVAPWAAVRAAGISPAECVLYADDQYARPDWRYARWHEAQDVTWIEGRELPADRPVALPASLVYLVSPPPNAAEMFAPATSNGLAAGPTLADAILGGLCEVMERDALLGCWMHRLPAVELEVAHADAATHAVCRQYARFGVEVRAFLLPTDLPAAVVMAVSFERAPGRPGQVIGMGCHPDPAVALRKAVYELCQGRPAEARRYADKPPQGRLLRYEDVHTLDDHSAFASLPERRDEFAFLWARGETARPGDLPNRSVGSALGDVAACAEALAALGSRVAYAELTTADVAPHGVRVVRVIATELQPVHFGHGQERLGGRRLFELPARLGLASGVVDRAALNPCPHPLA